jgi:hypothetical protein
MRVHLEKQIGRKLNFGGFYHVVGNIEGAFEFDIHRVIKNYFRMMTPLEHRDKVVFGKVYNIRIKLIEEMKLNNRQREIVANAVGVQYRPLMYRLRHAEIDPVIRSVPVPVGLQNQAGQMQAHVERLEGLSATFNPIVRLHSGRDPRLYFRIDMSSFGRKTGVEIEEGGFYRLGGRIGDVGTFQKTLRSMASRQDIPFYVPPKLQGKLQVGKEYGVTIDWIEKLPRPIDWHEGKNVDIESWT